MSRTRNPHDVVPAPDDQVDASPRRPRRRPRRHAAILFPLQFFLAAGWFRAGVEKVIDRDWWTGEQLTRFLEIQEPAVLPFFAPFADSVLAPLAPLVSWLVVGVQLGIALCLVSNRRVKLALWAGVALNVCFTMAGRVNPSAFYLVMQITLLFALSRPVGVKVALRRSVLWLGVATAFTPFVRTLHPAHVIDDPAVMLSFVSVLVAVTTLAVLNQPAQLVELVTSMSVGRRATDRLQGTTALRYARGFTARSPYRPR